MQAIFVPRSLFEGTHEKLPIIGLMPVVSKVAPGIEVDKFVVSIKVSAVSRSEAIRSKYTGIPTQTSIELLSTNTPPPEKLVISGLLISG